MLDLVLANGTVVTPEGPANVDIGISGERIAALGGRGQLARVAQRSISVSGKIVVPGGIDPHVHCNWPFLNPRTGGNEITFGQDVVSRAALHGGTTMLVDFVGSTSQPSLVRAAEKQAEDWTGSCYCDFSFHLVLRGEVPEETIAEIPEAIEAGWPSFKIYTTNIRPTRTDLKIAYGSLWEIFRQTRKDGIVCVHAEDDDLVMHMHRKLSKAGLTSFEHMPEVHSSLSEDLSFRRVIRLAEHEDAALYMMHVSAAFGVEAIAEARRSGLPIFGETLPQYALHTQDDYLEPDGMKYHTYPSIKTKKDAEALWAGMRSGDISTLGTDELCTTYEMKTAGRRIDDVVGGNAGVEPRLALCYTEIVNRRGMSLNRFVDLTSGNAARIMGMYPQKGCIAVGSDADLAVLDPNGGRTLTAAELHETDYTPWEGWKVDAWPVMTILRGEVVVDKDGFHATPKHGRRIARRR